MLTCADTQASWLPGCQAGPEPPASPPPPPLGLQVIHEELQEEGSLGPVLRLLQQDSRSDNPLVRWVPRWVALYVHLAVPGTQQAPACAGHTSTACMPALLHTHHMHASTCTTML